jgi:hypothetical protein
MLRSMCVALALCLVSGVVGAEEFVVLGGPRASGGDAGQAWIWSLEYRHPVGPVFALSGAMMNEGHLDNHHRDGLAVQAWLSLPLGDPRLVVAAGIGPYGYFDTTRASDTQPEIDAHGWGILYSVGAAWRATDRWSLGVRVNRVETRTSFNSTMVLGTVGYQLDDVIGSTATSAAAFGEVPTSEIAVLVGASVVNDFEAHTGFAKSIEYRRRIGRYLDASIAWMNEGNPRLVRRNAMTLQLWGVQHLLEDRATLEAGVGPYIVLDRYASGESSGVERLAAIVTLGASWRIAPKWRARLMWNRVFAEQPYDSDVFLVGGSYLF